MAKTVRQRIRARVLGGMFVAILFAALAPTASAYPILFSGGGGPGTTGNDPFGHDWMIKTDSWGSPGLFEGTLLFLGPDSALDYHVRFSGLPRGVVIDPTPSTIPGGSDTTTRFSNLADNQLWSRIIDPDGLGVHFLAGPGASLENGEQFFVNVHFTSQIQGLQFEASWTGTSVPEPGTLAMLLAGLSGAVIRRRRNG